MELKEGKISITYDEVCRIRKMGRGQMERYLTDAMQLGYRQGYADSGAEADAEIRRALEANDRKWRRAVGNTVDMMKGIGKKRKELLMEYLKIEMERTGICRK